jgi:hypothetical protein
METKLWANSGDSHFLEPADLWESPELVQIFAIVGLRGAGGWRRVSSCRCIRAFH